ncbi:MAG: flagellin [Phycisphaerales bacterium]
MSAIPANLSRVPNLLSSQLLMGNITRTSIGLVGVQNQMANGFSVSRFSDDAISASAISLLQDRMARTNQRLSNLQNAQGSLDYLDASLGSATDLILEARNIASDQVGVPADTTTRQTQAVVIDGMIRSLLSIANRETNGLYVFGGSTATRRPIEELRGGFRYVGRGPGLRADLDPSDDIPITIGGDNSIGETSSRLRSLTDLNPWLTGDTRLTDLRGARGLGVAPGSIEFTFDGGPAARVDLSGADTAQDVVDRLTAAIRQYETDHGVTILGSGGVGLSVGALSFDVVAGGGAGGTDQQLVFRDIGNGTTAQDLGLAGGPFENSVPQGVDLDPRLTLLTPLNSLPGISYPLGSIRFRFNSGGQSQLVDVDLSPARTVDDLRSIIETSVPGVRVEVNESGRGLSIFNEVSGPSMSIEEVPGGTDTATQLGIRTMAAQTPISDFNSGRGVRIVHGQADPVTGMVSAAVNTDFRITLGNGQAFDVDLRPEDLVNVQSVIDRINQEFVSAIGQPPLNPSAPPLAAGDFIAGLTDGQNGIAFTQTVTGGPLSVEKLNNSAAAEDLGLLNGTYDAGSASLIAQDRAAVRVNNLFTALLDLRDALRNDDTSGITLAGDALGKGLDRLAATRALVGVYANRVDRSTRRQEDLQVNDERTRSQLQDLDFSQASITFSLLRTQLQAAMTSGVQSQNLTLLDFLG